MFQEDCVGFTDNLLENPADGWGSVLPLKGLGPVACSYHERGLPLAVSRETLSPASKTSRNLNVLWALGLFLKIQQCTNGYDILGHQDHPNFHGQYLSFHNNQALLTARWLFGTPY